MRWLGAVAATVCVIGAAPRAPRGPWRHADKLDVELRSPSASARLRVLDEAAVASPLVGGVRVLHTLHARTRYFSVVATPGGDVWTLARDGAQADACHRAPCDQLLWTGGSPDRLLSAAPGTPRVLVDDDGAAHNFAIAAVDGALLAAGGLRVSPASVG